MTFIDSFLLGGVEGITEFLPISSTGHLILASYLFKIPQTEFVKSFEIIIQLGAILGVLILYWKKLLLDKNLLIKTFVAFLPTAIIGLAFYKIIKTYLLGNVYVTLASLLIGGIVLILLELLYKEKEHHLDSLKNLTFKQAILIGCFQGISVIPGVSRAAATIIGGLFLGLKRQTATEFSFILAIPTMAAATGLDLLKTGFHFSSGEYLMLATGLITSFTVAILTVKFLISYVQKNNFIPFGVYRIIVAILFWIFIVR